MRLVFLLPGGGTLVLVPMTLAKVACGNGFIEIRPEMYKVDQLCWVTLSSNRLENKKADIATPTLLLLAKTVVIPREAKRVRRLPVSPVALNVDRMLAYANPEHPRQEVG